MTLASVADIDAIVEQASLVESGWRNRFPHGSSPFTSTIVFLVRAGNPKNVRNWDDLIRPDIRVIAPSPKVSGAGRYAYLAAWAYALKQGAGDEIHAERFVASVYAKNPVLDEGAWCADGFPSTRASGRIVDVGKRGVACGHYRRQGQSRDCLSAAEHKAEPVVAVVDRYVADRGTTERAVAYLNSLFSSEAQEIAARHHLRTRDPVAAARYAGQFRDIELFDFSEVFGNWKDTARKHFAPLGTFDPIYNFEQLKRNATYKRRTSRAILVCVRTQPQPRLSPAQTDGRPNLRHRTAARTRSRLLRPSPVVRNRMQTHHSGGP